MEEVSGSSYFYADEKAMINPSPATFQGEPVSELIPEYWYNIALLALLVYVSAFITEFVMLWGFAKGWPRWNDLHISHFSQTVFPVPDWPQEHSKFDKAKQHAWKVLLAYRIVVLLFCIFVWFWTLFADTNGNLYEFFSFYTIWNFSMLICYFGCNIFLTILNMTGKDYPKLVKIVGNFTIIIYNIEIALVFLVDSVVWVILLPVLYKQGNVAVILTFSSSIVHGMNSVFMVIDFVFNRLPIRLFNITWMVVWALVYIFWAMLYYTVTYRWRYPFLNLWTPTAMVWYAIVFGMHFVFFFLCYGAYLLKLKICRKVFPDFDETINVSLQSEEDTYQ